MGQKQRLDRAQIVAVAAELADKAGSADAVTLAQVAEVFGVRVPSLYYYLEGSDALRRELALRATTQLIDELRMAALGHAGVAALHRMMWAFRAYALAHPGCYSTVQRAPAADDQELVAASEKFVEVLLRVLEPMQIVGEDALHVVRGLRSLAHGFIVLEASGGFGLPLARDESYRRLVDTYLAGLMTVGDADKTA
jgi:AcrR family transcriptional regulator